MRGGQRPLRALSKMAARPHGAPPALGGKAAASRRGRRGRWAALAAGSGEKKREARRPPQEAGPIRGPFPWPRSLARFPAAGGEAAAVPAEAVSEQRRALAARPEAVPGGGEAGSGGRWEARPVRVRGK